MAAKLSRRDKEILRKFEQGYTAWCRPTVYIAYLVPPAGSGGKAGKARTDTLDGLVQLGFLSQQQMRTPIHNMRGDIHWTLRSLASPT